MGQLQAIAIISAAGIMGAAGIVYTTTFTSATFTSTSATAQTCTALPVINGQGTQVQKSVSPPGTGVTRDNWSTDFLVPSNQNFRRYVARVIPRNGGEYEVLMSLKYNNDTADKVFNRTLQLPEGRAYSIQGMARANSIPYQVNVEVGGLRAIGNTYTVSALGCY